jgi:pimeloyl-ACP methyl ester carboxylesterase
MRATFEIEVDVSEAVGVGLPARTVASVHLPGALCDPPVVCFAFPGGGYGRRYFSFDVPGDSGGGEAGFHCARGWIVVTCDYLGAGDATQLPSELQSIELTLRANRATVDVVLGELARRLPSADAQRIPRAALLGIGQSLGGFLTIALQGQHHVFDGVGILGYSAIHTVVASRPGTTPPAWPWIVREAHPRETIVANAPALAAGGGQPIAAALAAPPGRGEHPFAWVFHFDDVPSALVDADLFAGVDAAHPLPVWRSATSPAFATLALAPGVVATEAASIRAPVLIAVGERDVVPNPWDEPRAYKSSPDVQLFVCERMAHMHNFASTRRELWERIHDWGTGVAAAKVRRGAASRASR